MASVTVAYILWFFGGIFGLHHLYLGRDGQALIWWLSWGGYVLGWLGDSGRISEYVSEANESREEKREKLRVLKKRQPKPELNYVTIGSYFMIGHLLSSVVVNAAPNTLLKAGLYGPMLTHFLITLGTTGGIYMINNTWSTKSPFLWPFLAGLCLFPITYIFPDKQPITVVLTTALGAYVSLECSDWKKDVPEQDGCHCTLKRLAVVFAVLLLHGSLWTSFMYFNVQVTSMNGTQVPLRNVMYNFMKTKPFEQTRNALLDFYPCIHMYSLDTCQTQFLRTLTELSDPTREDWAFKVLAFEEKILTTKKIQSHCRKLSSKFHPDKHRNVGEVERLEIEKKFLEIQQACGILNKIKINRERRNTWNNHETVANEEENLFDNDGDNDLGDDDSELIDKTFDDYEDDEVENESIESTDEFIDPELDRDQKENTDNDKNDEKTDNNNCSDEL